MNAITKEQYLEMQMRITVSIANTVLEAHERGLNRKNNVSAFVALYSQYIVDEMLKRNDIVVRNPDVRPAPTPAPSCGIPSPLPEKLK